MSEKDFDKGYKSGFKFGKEVANEEWRNKVKQARDEIENYNVLNNFALNTETFKVGITRGLDLAVEILDKLIAESEEQHG